MTPNAPVDARATIPIGTRVYVALGADPDGATPCTRHVHEVRLVDRNDIAYVVIDDDTGLGLVCRRDRVTPIGGWLVTWEATDYDRIDDPTAEWTRHERVVHTEWERADLLWCISRYVNLRQPKPVRGART